MCVMATILVCGVSSRSNSSSRNSPLSEIGAHFSTAPLALAVEVPGHDVGVVLHDREHDLVALADSHAAERAGDEVDRLGGVAGEDDLLGAAGIEEAAHGLARLLEALRRRVGEVVQAAVHVGVLEAVGVIHRLDHRARLLRRGAVVEIDERLAVDLAEQDREVGADALDVVGPPPTPARSVALVVALPQSWRRRPLAIVAFAAGAAARRASSRAMRHQRLAHGLVLDLVDRLADERFDQQRARLARRDAARAAIEQQILVELGRRSSRGRRRRRRRRSRARACYRTRRPATASAPAPSACRRSSARRGAR